MTKINSEDLILFQRGELSEVQMDHIKNELMSNQELQKELEVLKKADMAMENHFNDFKMPEDFRNKVKKKFKKKFNLFSFLDSRLIFSYSGGLATACLIFAVFLSINEKSVYEEQTFTNANTNLKLQNELDDKFSKEWDVTRDLVFNTKMSHKDFYFTIIPLNDKIINIVFDQEKKVTPIYNDLFLKKGVMFKSENILLPEKNGIIKILENSSVIYSKEIKKK